jgi:hypothetical protein
MDGEHPNQLGTADRLRLNEPKVAMQVIDGEAILIHFERGFYFSARALGCELLRGLALGLSTGEMADALTARGVDREQALALVFAYRERVVAEELLVTDSAASAPSAAWDPLVGATDFGDPELVKYTDLEDLLKLDPIHDVDEAGWPPAAEGTSAKP